MSSLGPSLDVRAWTDPVTGYRYRVRISPWERRGSLGVDRRLSALVFETAEGEWVGSVPIYRNVALWGMGERDLAERLVEALGRG